MEPGPWKMQQQEPLIFAGARALENAGARNLENAATRTLANC